MSVIHLKTRAKPARSNALRAIDVALGEVFCRLAEQHGVYAVTTVALTYIAEAIQHARETQRPIEAKWIADLEERFAKALKGAKDV